MTMTPDDEPKVYATVTDDRGLRLRVCAACGQRMPGWPTDDVPERCFQCLHPESES